MKKNEKPITVEQTFDASAEEVWKAITELDLMRQWYFENIPAFIPVVGFKTEFNVVSDGRNFLHKWRITEVIPGKVITYSWQFEEYPGEGLVEFNISSEKNKTKLRLTNYVLEDFPDNVPEFTRESCHGGWTYFINERLKEFLEKDK